MAEGVRYGLLVRTCLEVLRDSGEPIPGSEVMDEVAKRIGLTEEELRPQKSGAPAWVVHTRFETGDAATAGWMVKRDGTWWITDAGRAALDAYPDPDQFFAEITRRYREVARSRKQARKKYENRMDAIAGALELVPAGSWTAYDDLAELVDGSPDGIAHLLAQTFIEGSHRVLQADGQVPAAMHQHVNYRGDDLRARLVKEGVEFDGRHAGQDQRITAEFLRERLAETTAADAPARRAWLVRGANVDGVDLVPRWLAEGWVSLAASQLPEVDPGTGEQRLHEIVAEAYRHKSYSVREKLAAQFNAFLRLMREGDLVLTVHRGDVHLGLVDGPPTMDPGGDAHARLRRTTRWLTAGDPLDLSLLPTPLPALIQSQDDVIDLTDGLDALERLYTPLLTEAEPAPPVRVAELGRVSEEFAAAVLTDVAWLGDVRDPLAERKQIILYGPPGTGKTYLAQKLAAHLTEPHAVRLIQFHPSYTYEDFFEGFRPAGGEDGTLRFKLTSGPLRALADDAREHPSTAYVLVIDEINRGNLAKVFGELYFLLEYRDQSIGLQYSREDFTLPTNLYLIGTMNTADRSISLVDAAMRRRFAFVELHPARPPVAGLLRRWLARKDLPTAAADLLDALNARLADSEYAIGPSYLMRPEAYAGPGGMERIWRYDILPLLVEHHYADEVDVAGRYGLPALRAAVASDGAADGAADDDGHPAG